MIAKQKRFNTSLRTLALSVPLLALMTFNQAMAHNLTTYVTEWSGYGATDGKGYPAYSFDGAYTSDYRSIKHTTNEDMVNKARKSDVLAYAFFQVWNQELIDQYKAPQEWLGRLHFSDIWANLPNTVVPEYAMWKQLCNSRSGESSLPEGTCAAVQLNGMTQKLQLFNFSTTDDIGQMNNFGAFLKLPQDDNARKIIAIGGANTPGNASISTRTFQTIFANQAAFIDSLAKFISAFKSAQTIYGVGAITGVDFDFEPPIKDGQQVGPDASTIEDYNKLYNLVVATRKRLGPDAYISVTITTNKKYLEVINSAMGGHWFKKISSEVNHINIMTYDLHGPWSNISDPGAISHIMQKHPALAKKDYSEKYGTEEIMDIMLQYGVDSKKLQLGLATYGRGFNEVAPGTNKTYPGFDQPWIGEGTFPKKYSDQPGFLPYKSVSALLKEGYSKYNILDVDDKRVIASYIYNPTERKLVGYMSPEQAETACQYVKDKHLGGAILWSMDTDASYTGSEGNSIIDAYSAKCR